DFLLRELVEPQRQTLREPAVVHEDDRRTVLAHEPEHLGIDRGPDRRSAALAASAGKALEVRTRAGLAHVLDRHHDAEIELLRNARIDEPNRTCPRDEAADLLERALRSGEADPLDRSLRQLLEALDADRKVRAALR